MGATSFVLEADIVPTESSPELSRMRIPPLVAKISRGFGSCAKQLSHDAFYHEEMKGLQGVVLARFFGQFSATVSESEDLGTLIIRLRTHLRTSFT